MSDVGDTVIDYALLKELDEAEEAGVFKGIGVPGENENRHVSELSYRMKALDEKETYIAIKAIVTTHWEAFSKSIQYLERKGRNGTD